MDKKIWGILIHLGRGMWGQSYPGNIVADKNSWDKIIDKCEECGLNTVVVDVGEGVQWKSHPELAVDNAWSYELLQSEIVKAKEKGIELIPKLNFSATHDIWLRDYHKMVSTDIYYKVCKDLIEEAYEMFMHPSYIHLGMDEENWKHAKDNEHTVIRYKNAFVKDFNYLAECAKNTGAKVHVWHDAYTYLDDEFQNQLDKDVIPDLWMYYSYLKEHWTPIANQSEQEKDYYENEFVRRYGYKIEFIEEDPFVTLTTEFLHKFIKEGRKFLLAPSNLFVKCSEVDSVKYIKEVCPDQSLFTGLMSAPWGALTPDKDDFHLEAIELIGKAKKEYYGE